MTAALANATPFAGFATTASLVTLAAALGGCGVSDAELEQAYRDGYRSGLIWCKRMDEKVAPDGTAALAARWENGWQEAIRLQCEHRGRQAGMLR